MKKYIIVGIFVFALTASVALASVPNNCWCERDKNDCKCPNTSVINANNASTINSITANSGTGGNAIKSVFGSAVITTGAATALGIAETRANDNNINVTTANWGKLTIFNANNAQTTNIVTANAGTGGNNIGCAGSSAITTGAASSTASALTVVNTNVIKVDRCCPAGCGSICLR